MGKISSLNYALGRLKALEERLIPADRWDQLAASPDLETLLKNIAGLGISLAEAERLDTWEGLEKLTAAWSAGLLADYRELPLPDGFLDWLTRREEFQNLRYLLRIKLEGWTEIPAWVVFSPLARTPVHVLADFVWHGTSWELARTWPAGLIKRLAPIVKAPVQRDRWSNSLIELDRVLLVYLKEEAARLGGPDLAELAALEIDAFNLENLARLWAVPEKTEGLEDYFLAGGTIQPPMLSGLATERPETLANHLHGTAWGHSLDQACAELSQTGSLAGLSSAIEAFFLEYLKTGRALGSGLPAATRYFRARRREIVNLRLLLAGFYYQLPGSAVRPLLRSAHV